MGRQLLGFLLDRDYEVWSMLGPNESTLPGWPCHDSLHSFSGDISRSFEFPVEPDVVFNCAGVIRDEGLMIPVNVEGTRHVAEAALLSRARLVHLSSAGVAGDTKHNPVTEKSKGTAQNTYELSKQMAEECVAEAGRKGLHYQVLRPTIIIGSGRDPSMDSFLQLIRAMVSGRYISMGPAFYNLVPVQEVARALWMLDNDGLSGQGVFIINSPLLFDDLHQIIAGLAPDRKMKLRHLPRVIMYPAAYMMEMVQKLSGRPMPFGLSRYDAMTNQKIFSQQLLEKTLDYVPERSLPEYVSLLFREYVQRGLL